MRSVRFLDRAGTIRTGEWKGDIIGSGGLTFDPDPVDILPPTEPTKIVCIGLNYADHVEETGREIPERPKLFLKTKNTIAGHRDVIPLLPDKERIDYEAELGVIIGKQCRNVTKERAMAYVRGFTCVNDVSNRDDQRIEQNWVRGKSFDNAAPMGPVIASPDTLPEDARITLRANGDIEQDSTIDRLIFSVPELIEEISTYMTLEEGDVISTGTPSGVGPIHPGDTIEIEIEGIGKLVNTFESPNK